MTFPRDASNVSLTLLLLYRLRYFDAIFDTQREENTVDEDINRSSLRVTLADVNNKLLFDDVEFKFYNIRLQSEKLQARVTLKGRPITIKGLPATPVGLTQVFITLTKYRSKSLFENIASDGTSQLNEVFFVDPSKVTPQFPAFSDVTSQRRWTGLARLLKDSGISTAKAWNNLTDLQKAGLFNIYSKMTVTLLGTRGPVSDFVHDIEEFRQERILARVDSNLINLVSSASQIFHTVSGALHRFDPPWEPVEPENSWKTFDTAGNLQLTFAADGKGNFLADIDLDDHQGIQHAFDVLEHKLTSNETHPYDIHEILIFFQHLDPGYSLS